MSLQDTFTFIADNTEYFMNNYPIKDNRKNNINMEYYNPPQYWDNIARVVELYPLLAFNWKSCQSGCITILT